MNGQVILQHDFIQPLCLQSHQNVLSHRPGFPCLLSPLVPCFPLLPLLLSLMKHGNDKCENSKQKIFTLAE